jgi:hypothetical protein
MEFFATADVRASVADLQRRLTIGDLSHWCASISEVFSDVGAYGEIYCVWGQFRVNREMIRDGVRFTLPGCPNALQWTVTTGQPKHRTPWTTEEDQGADHGEDPKDETDNRRRTGTGPKLLEQVGG